MLSNIADTVNKHKMTWAAFFRKKHLYSQQLPWLQTGGVTPVKHYGTLCKKGVKPFCNNLIVESGLFVDGSAITIFGEAF